MNEGDYASGWVKNEFAGLGNWVDGEVIHLGRKLKVREGNGKELVSFEYITEGVLLVPPNSVI